MTEEGGTAAEVMAAVLAVARVGGGSEAEVKAVAMVVAVMAVVEEGVAMAAVTD